MDVAFVVYLSVLTAAASVLAALSIHQLIHSLYTFKSGHMTVLLQRNSFVSATSLAIYLIITAVFSVYGVNIPVAIVAGISFDIASLFLMMTLFTVVENSIRSDFSSSFLPLSPCSRSMQIGSTVNRN